MSDDKNNRLKSLKIALDQIEKDLKSLLIK